MRQLGSAKRRQGSAQGEAEAQEPCSSSSLPAAATKRARFSSESAEQVRVSCTPTSPTHVAHMSTLGLTARSFPYARGATGTLYRITGACFDPWRALQAPARFRHGAAVLRPGIPAPIELSDFKLPDRHSPPLRGDDKEGHYNYELGDNISSRCELFRGIC